MFDVGLQTAAAKGLVAGVTVVEQIDGTTVRLGDDGNVHPAFYIERSC